MNMTPENDELEKKNVREFKFMPDKELDLLDVVELDNETTIKVSTFFNALLKISSNYYSYCIDESKKVIEHVERVFAYELYHQWSNLLTKEDGFIINGEIGKQLEYFDQQSNIFLGRAEKYPDLVLHKGQDEVDGNMIVCEIKRKKNEVGFLNDLLKLAIFTSNHNEQENKIPPYKCGIFVLVNSSQQEFLSAIKNDKIKYKSEFDYITTQANSKKIICVFCTADNATKEISYNSLFNLLNSKE